MLVGVLVAVIAVVVVQGIRSSHHRAFLERQRDAVSLFSDTISSHLPQENRSIGQGTVFLFPQLVQELDNLSAKTTKPADSLATARFVSWQGAGTGAFPRTACISGLVDSMLIDGVVPDSGTLCPP